MKTEPSMEELVEYAESLVMDKTKLFDLGNGLVGYVSRLNYFRHVDGIDSIEFTPIQNMAYYAECSELGDAFIVTVSEWIDLLTGVRKA